MDAVEQLDQAVTVALQGDDPGIKSQALAFIQQVESDPQAWWQPSLDIVASGQRSDSTEFFALQIVERTISTSTDEQQLHTIRAKLWARLQTASSAPAHLRNKLAAAVKDLFVQLYMDQWPTLFGDLLQLVDQDLAAADMYVRVLQAVHNEIGDQLFARDETEAKRATMLKDALRDRDVPQLAGSWLQLLESAPGPIKEGVLQVIAGWVSWIDVSLLVPGTPLILKQLADPAVRQPAVLALIELLSKKMAPEYKLELVQHSGVVPALASLESSGDIEFDELLAKLVNSILFEMAHLLNQLPSSDTPVGAGAEQIIVDIMPLVLEFLGNEYDDTSVQLVSGIGEYLSFLRKTRPTRSVVFGSDLSPQRKALLSAILEKLVVKSRYDPEDYDESAQNEIDEDGESDIDEFAEFRAKVRVLQEQLAQIDTQLFLEFVGQYVTQQLTSAQDWTAQELALYELSVYGDVARAWVVKATKSGAELAEIAQQVSEVQFQLFAAMIDAAAASQWNHPAVQIWYMEIVNRAAPQFLSDNSPKDRAPLLSKIFDFFMKQGVQSQQLRVRVRAWYMFYRLVRAVRRTSFVNTSGVAQAVFQAIASMLPVEVKPPKVDDLVLASQTDTIFGSQMYLYELCGILFAAGNDTTELAELARQLLAQMFADIDGASTKTDPVDYLRIHHNVVALSALTKGLSETRAEMPNRNLESIEVQMKTATQMVVAVLERLHNIQIVREACRSAFSRMLSLLGSKILLEISSFIDVLLQTSGAQDLGDFLSFLGQLAHEFSKDEQVFDMFTSLCGPLFEKVFGVLQEAARTADLEAKGSTDAALFRRDIVGAYLQLVFNLLNNNYGAMLFVKGNAPVFENIMSSLLHYSRNGDVAGGSGAAANQKMSVGIVQKMVTLWSSGKVPEGQFCEGAEVPMFSDVKTYELLTELCWSIPAESPERLQDAQSRMVLAELAGLQKALWDSRGAAYQEQLVQYLNRAGLPAGAIEELALKLNAPPKDFKRFYLELLQKVMAR